jgi:hypothetical protein
MIHFPTRILLASGGSGAARLAAQRAVELANETGHDLHGLYVEEVR